jgi:hypothetical protein
MAVAEARLIRLERNLTHALNASEFFNSLGAEPQDPATVHLDRELKIQRLVNGVSQQIARTERAWHKALDTLLKLQDRRRKDETRKPAPAGKQPQVASAPQSDVKNPHSSRRSGDQIPPNEVESDEVYTFRPFAQLLQRLDAPPPEVPANPESRA